MSAAARPSRLPSGAAGAVVVLLALVALGGCAQGRSTTVAALRDKAGRLPGQALLMRTAAQNRHDWRTVYALTADPAADYGASAREWIASNDQTRGLRVLETRVIGSGKGKGDALVRVIFTTWTTAPGGTRYAVSVRPPGEWMTLAKVGGLWKLVVDV